ncbi:unnamed protein product, partial [Cyprideis torosa]
MWCPCLTQRATGHETDCTGLQLPVTSGSLDRGLTVRSLSPSCSWSERDVELTYENFGAAEIIEAVVGDPCRGHSRIGHLVQFNLREHLLPYKHLIGQVILDKLQPAVTTVVNKSDNIVTEFRNFQFEVLAGDGNTQVSVFENNCTFEFDFAKVSG